MVTVQERLTSFNHVSVWNQDVVNAVPFLRCLMEPANSSFGGAPKACVSDNHSLSQQEIHEVFRVVVLSVVAKLPHESICVVL